MSIFDGSPDDLTYGEALDFLADRVSWPTEEHGRAVKKAIRTEHGMNTAEPEVFFNDARDATITAQDQELAELRRKVALQEKAEKEKANAAELERLRALVNSDQKAADESPRDGFRIDRPAVADVELDEAAELRAELERERRRSASLADQVNAFNRFSIDAEATGASTVMGVGARPE